MQTKMAHEELVQIVENKGFDNWVDLSNFLFNPDDGLLVREFQTREEREEFVNRCV